MKSFLKQKIEKNLVSVIIVTYNQEKYIKDTIKSILNQNYNNIEIIIADDGTPNFNVENIKKYIEEKKKENIKYISVNTNKNNLGTVKNINNALRLTRGGYIKIIGGDDTFFSSTTFSDQIKVLEFDHTKYAVIGKANQCDEFMNSIYDKRVDDSNKAISSVLSMNFSDAMRYIHYNDLFPIAIQTICFRRVFFEKMGLCDEEYYLIDDAPTVIKILECSKFMCFTDDYSVNHRGKIGISATKKIFDTNKIMYYKDNMIYFKKEIRNRKNIFGFFYRNEMTRLYEYIYMVTLYKKNKHKFWDFVKLTILKSDALVYFILTRPKKVFERLFLYRSV